MNLDAIKARLSSINPAKRLRIATISTAADRVLEDVRWLISEVQRLRSEVSALKALEDKDD